MELDIGCGGSEQFSSYKSRGDVNCDVLKPADKIPNFVLCDAHHLPFKDNIFEKVYMYDLVEHLESPLKALREAFRVICRNGILELGTPNALYLPKVIRAMRRGFYSPHRDHIATWGLPELRTLLKKAGFNQFKIEYTTYLDSLHKGFERFLLSLCIPKALRYRQLLAIALK